MVSFYSLFIKIKKESKTIFSICCIIKHNQNNIQNLRVGSGLPNIQKQNIVNFQIPLPPLKEQEKIADCLLEVDTMIKEQSNKVEQLKKHKKGLMQRLFPSLEEAEYE